MPILLLYLVATLGITWFQSETGPFDGDPVVLDAAPARPVQDRCRDRMDAARSQAARSADFPEFARGELRTDDNPGGRGGVWYRLELADGSRYGAGLSGPQGGGIVDTDWQNLNGTVEPADCFSHFRDQAGRSGFVAAVDPDTVRRRAFQLVFEQALDDCLEMTE